MEKTYASSKGRDDIPRAFLWAPRMGPYSGRQYRAHQEEAKNPVVEVSGPKNPDHL